MELRSGTGILPVQFFLVLDDVFQSRSTPGFLGGVRLPNIGGSVKMRPMRKAAS